MSAILRDMYAGFEGCEVGTIFFFLVGRVFDFVDLDVGFVVALAVCCGLGRGVDLGVSVALDLGFKSDFTDVPAVCCCAFCCCFCLGFRCDFFACFLVFVFVCCSLLKRLGLVAACRVIRFIVRALNSRLLLALFWPPFVAFGCGLASLSTRLRLQARGRLCPEEPRLSLDFGESSLRLDLVERTELTPLERRRCVLSGIYSHTNFQLERATAMCRQI